MCRIQCFHHRLYDSSHCALPYRDPSLARAQLTALQREFDDQELSLGRLEQRLEQQLAAARTQTAAAADCAERLSRSESAREAAEEALASAQADLEISVDSLRAELEEAQHEMREQQQMAWSDLPVTVAPVLPGTIPVLTWFAAERGHAGPLVAQAD